MPARLGVRGDGEEGVSMPDGPGIQPGAGLGLGGLT